MPFKMNFKSRLIASVFLLLLIAPAGKPLRAADYGGARLESFNQNWKFARGAQPGAEAVDFDDASWLPVRLPHDWAVAGPYEPEGDSHTGKLPWRGEGWYRKSFSLSAQDAGKRVYLDFDGVMAMPTVYVGGRKAGGWDYGYMSFRVDVTEFVKFGENNIVAVHADTRPHTSRWYPGAGIYRKVMLVVKNPIHMGHWGTFVTTPDVTDASATIGITTEVENHGAEPSQADLEAVVMNPAGKQVAMDNQSMTISARGNGRFSSTVTVPRPERWDVETPRLYKVVTRLSVGGKLIDTGEIPFGIRTFEFTADDGFNLNGRRLQLKGVNLHHDQGPLGAAFLTRAMERQLEIMKDMGVNAIRTSHNPPAPELLDLCDRMGFVVWNELFDKWDGTATRLPEVSILQHGRKQIQNFVRRDRNHPSVVIWSVGNEIWDLEDGKLPDSPGLLSQMVGYVKDLDPTRPVGLGQALPRSARTALPKALDVAGWNYQRRYAISRETYPNLPIVYSESASAYSTRGHYELPHATAKDDYSASLRISSYDHNSASWADLPDTEFALMEQDRFVAGEFVWTGFDYLGEPVPFVAQGWGSFSKRKISPEEESRISCFGIVDLVGIPKDRFYLYRSYWAPQKKTVHLLPHWNWPERIGQVVPVYVYTSGDSAELFLNGKSLGRKSKDPRAANPMDRYRLRWEDVVYQPGEVKAVAYQTGRRVGEATVRTAGAPARLSVTPDRSQLGSDGDDLCYLLVEALDQEGNLCPLAMDQVTFEVTGPVSIAGVGNGDHHFPAEFDSDHVSLFYGKAMLILRTREGRGGSIRVRAESKGLQPATVSVQATEAKR
jgi:beta-galactosidase